MEVSTDSAGPLEIARDYRVGAQDQGFLRREEEPGCFRAEKLAQVVVVVREGGKEPVQGESSGSGGTNWVVADGVYP